MQGVGKNRENLQRSPITFHFHHGNGRKTEIVKKYVVYFITAVVFFFSSEIDLPCIHLDIKSTDFVVASVITQS